MTYRHGIRYEQPLEALEVEDDGYDLEGASGAEDGEVSDEMAERLRPAAAAEGRQGGDREERGTR